MPGTEDQPPTDEQISTIRTKFQDYISENGKDVFEEVDINRVMNDDAYISRWFMHVYDSKGGQMDSCIQSMIGALKWRKKENINGLTADNLNSAVKEKGSIYMKNKDKDGCPLLIFAMAKHVKGEYPEDMKKLFVYYLDRIDRETSGGKLSLVYECAGCGITNMDMDLIAYMIKCLEEYYPYNLNHILVIDMSWLLTAAWKVIKGWLPPAGVKMIKFLSKSNLSEYIPEDQQLAVWGGKSEWTYEFVEENVKK